MNNQPLFGRTIEVLFGMPGQPALKYAGLRVTFKIEKTSKATPNKGQVAIYNLNASSRARAEEGTKKKPLYLILRAGYGDSAEDIFKGDVASSKSDLEGSDYVTTFELGDGLKAYQEAKIERSYESNVNIKDVAQDIIKSFGKAVGDISSLKDGKFLNGITLSGHAREQLTYITEKQGLEWSIQDDAVQVVKKGGKTVETAVVISPTSGLLGIPNKKDKGAIEFRCMLQPQIKPGRAIVLQSRTISGNFRCNKVTMSGDNFGTDFSCTVEADPL